MTKLPEEGDDDDQRWRKSFIRSVAYASIHFPIVLEVFSKFELFSIINSLHLAASYQTARATGGKLPVSARARLKS